MLFWIECHRVVPKVLHLYRRNGALFVPFHSMLTLQNELHAVKILSRTTVIFSAYLPSAAAHILHGCDATLWDHERIYALTSKQDAAYNILYIFAQKANFFISIVLQLRLFIAFNAVHVHIFFVFLVLQLRKSPKCKIYSLHPIMMIMIMIIIIIIRIMFTLISNPCWLTSPSERIRLKIALKRNTFVASK